MMMIGSFNHPDWSGCLYTEWFDLDEPCKRGEIESVYVSNIYAATLGKSVRLDRSLEASSSSSLNTSFQGRHRSCASRNIQYPAEFRTLDGLEKVMCSELPWQTRQLMICLHWQVSGLIHQTDKDKIVCYNEKNKHKPEPPYHWHDKEVTCRDFKMRWGLLQCVPFKVWHFLCSRYCCKNLWGEALGSDKIPTDDAIVDPPFRKTLFEECEWRNFMSIGQGSGVGDVESRSAWSSSIPLISFWHSYIQQRKELSIHEKVHLSVVQVQCLVHWLQKIIRWQALGWNWWDHHQK